MSGSIGGYYSGTPGFDKKNLGQVLLHRINELTVILSYPQEEERQTGAGLLIQLEWSPEIEYAYAGGHAIELELPLENTSLNEYKVSLQGYLGKLDKGRMIHGWQAIGRRIIHEKVFAAEVLYLNDYKFSDKWSMMNMVGVRHTALGKSRDFIGLMNNSLFYSYSKQLSLGIELNNEIGERDWRYLITPQLQYIIGKNVILQLGGGPSKLNEKKKIDWLLTSRLTYDF